MELAIIQRWNKRIHGEAENISPEGHYLKILSLDTTEFFSKDFGVFQDGLDNGSLSLEIVRPYTMNEYDLALPTTSPFRVLQRKWKNNHRYISSSRVKRLNCIAELKSFQNTNDDYTRNPGYILARLDGMPELDENFEFYENAIDNFINTDNTNIEFNSEWDSPD